MKRIYQRSNGWYPAMKPYIGKTFTLTKEELKEFSFMGGFEVESPIVEVEIIGVFHRGFWFICEIEENEHILWIAPCKKKLNYLK